MEPTTTRELSDAFVAAVHAITPRHPHRQDTRWSHTPSERLRGRANVTGTELRSFDLVWTDVRPSFLWYGTGHEAYSAELRVGTSYRGVPPDSVEHMVGEDGIDLRRMFSQLPGPTPGLSHVEFITPNYDTDAVAEAVVEHRFRVHWAQRTD